MNKLCKKCKKKCKQSEKVQVIACPSFEAKKR